MADKPQPGSQAPNGAAVGAPADASDEALLAELEAAQGGAPAAKRKPAKPAPPADDDAADEPADEAEGDAEGDEDAAADDDAEDAEGDEFDEDADDEDDDPDEDEEDEDGEDDDDELDDGAAEADPELKKRIAAVRRTEQRQRQRMQREREEFQRERDTFATESKQLRERAATYDRHVARAKIDPAGLLEALGLSHDDMEYAAQQCYARSKAAREKPEYAAAARAAAAQREATEKANAAERRIAELEQKLAKGEQQTAVQRELDAYFDRACRKATSATPITKRLIDKRPKTARAELAATAGRLADKLGRMPKVSELLAAHEKREVRALKLRGIAPPTAAARTSDADADGTAAKSATSGKPAKVAGKKPAARAAEVETDEGADLAIPTNADLVRELRASQRN